MHCGRKPPRSSTRSSPAAARPAIPSPSLKVTKQTRGTAMVVVLCAIVFGSIAWEIVERLLAVAGTELDLTVGRLGFDLQVIAFHIEANPGTLLGALGGWLLVRAL